jgi:hypothetical protein
MRLAMAKQAVHLDMALCPDWKGIDPIREAVARCVEVAYRGEDGLDEALAMVTAELLENAVKYGNAEDFGIAFSLRGDPDRLEVTVSHAAGNDPRHLANLLRRVQWLGQFSDSAEAYHAALEEIYLQAPVNSGAGGLGIVRIAHEGGCQVVVDTSDPGRVTVRAHRSVVLDEPEAGQPRDQEGQAGVEARGSGGRA